MAYEGNYHGSPIKVVAVHSSNPLLFKRSRGSSVSIVSDYGLDDRGSISLLSNGYRGGPFPGGKARPERDADHSPPSSAEE
jgi:hypothetical protein